MAKKSRKHKKPVSGQKHMVSHPSYAGHKYDCYGKRVRAGRGHKKVARVFCAKDKQAKSA